MNSQENDSILPYKYIKWTYLSIGSNLLKASSFNSFLKHTNLK